LNQGAPGPAAGGSGALLTAGEALCLDGRAAALGAAALLFILGLALRPWLQSLPSPYLEYAVFVTAYGLAGGEIIWKALRNLLRGRVLDEYFLMAAAGTGAAAIGELPEAVAVVLFFRVGELLEQVAVNRSRRSIAALMGARPDYAILVAPRGEEIKVSPEEVRPGQEIIVRPGEKVPLDGEIVRGESFVDQAALTGEPVPRRVSPGDPVPAGAINGSGLLRVKVLKEYSESSLAKIFKLVQEAAARKAKTEKFITRFARIYTPAVVGGAAALALIPPLIIPGAAFNTWFYRALVLLVISCPCALVISIPLGYIGGIGSASRHGILIKGGNYLEALLKVKTVVFDKTGTLTRGVFRVAQVLPHGGHTEEEILYWAAHAEIYSNHPIARSIREAYRDEIRPETVGDHEERKGLGVRASVDGKTVLAGNSRLLQEEGVAHDPCGGPGCAVYLAVEGSYIGCLVISDTVRDDAAAAVSRLKELGVTKTVMLTGDSPEAAAAVAARVGIDAYSAGLLPGGKVERIEALLAGMAGGRGKLAFVGDGINDAPALTRADVGIAMGGMGSDAAIEAADVVIMDDRPGKVAGVMQIAAFTRKIVVQNIAMALGVKGFFLLMGAFGAASVWEAVFADVGVAILAILNAGRALGYKPR
jgi:Cd2+/Zn2+-exporting ATPase